MKKRNPTNKDIIERLDDFEKRMTNRFEYFEKRNTILSGVILLYSIAIALIIGYYSTYNILFIFLGVACYASGTLLAIKKGTKI